MHVFRRSSLWAAGFLVVLSAAAAVLLTTTPVSAAGERYRYINANTIEVSGGDMLRGPARLTVAEGSTYEGQVELVDSYDILPGTNCDFELTLNANDNDAARGVVSAPGTILDCDEEQKIQDNFTGPVTIANVPPGLPNPNPPTGSGTPTCESPYTYNQERASCVAPRNADGSCPGDGKPMVVNGTLMCETEATSGDADQEVQCTTESGLSWIICPALTIAQEGAIAVANLLDILLSVPILEADSGSSAYIVWTNMRNFANVLFIFVLFSIIFSQATSMGISAYGVKKILPKLVAAVILANLSFFLCAFAVDLFNIIGGGIRDLVIGTLAAPEGTTPTQGSADGGSSVVGNITSVLAGISVVGLGIAAVVAIGIFFPTILGALLVALLTLAARQALIIVLVIMSPIAFAAWVLPNTEQYFRQWWDYFLSALVMYPLIMLLFAGSNVASTIFGQGGFGG